MVFDIQRRQILRYLNTTYTYWNTVSGIHRSISRCPVQLIVSNTLLTSSLNDQPLLHAIVAFIELAIMSRLVAKFHGYYAEHPSTSIQQLPVS